ncbi:hypothetical protein A9Q84_15590 [Halobacteriovorax marinus]|uniref:Uncharacterized protein n=1 Tax=Halobacteriovorax marinus TaxID=97084 RepID=A0A1Y5F3V0_9BACT|nr:hypothetical protein A9Q84_15590 [Halobacteriovorax marinus]
MKCIHKLILACAFLFQSSVLAQGIYSDFGIERIYCFSNDSDIELEFIQNDNVLHTFSTQGGDIYNLIETVTVQSVPNGVAFHLPDIDKSAIVVLIDSDDNVSFEGLDTLTGTDKKIDFDCELN